MNDKIKAISDLLEVQGRDGTWNYDPYMHGMYNALELSLSILEDRDPVFREAPEQWLHDNRQSFTIGIEESESNDTK
jgi:hypothetical protein